MSEKFLFGMHPLALCLTAAIGLGLSACSAPTVGGEAAGRAPANAGLDATGKDCVFVERLLRDGGSFCASRSQSADAALNPALLGFAPVDRRAAEDFSLEIARKKSVADPGTQLSFGLLSATFGQSWTYNLNLRGTAQGAPAKVADAMTTGSTAAPGLRPRRGDYFGL